MKKIHTVKWNNVEIPWFLLQFKCPDKETYDLANGIIPEKAEIDNPYEIPLGE